MAAYLKRPHIYDFEVQTMVTAFMSALSDIVVTRYNGKREPRDRIKTRLVYAPKQRVLADILDKDQNLQLPVVAVYIGNITRDLARVTNKIVGTYAPQTNGGYVNQSSPLPIDLALNVTIVTRYQADMDQIISHILPYINPYFVVSWTTPGRRDQEIRSNVFWDGNATFSYPYDISANQVARVTADLGFVFKGWMFPSKAQESTRSIYTIKTSYVGGDSGVPVEYLLTSDYTSGLSASTNFADYWQIDGAPPMPKTIEPYYVNTGAYQQFNVFGTGFKAINNVYLSGGPLSAVMTNQNPFSAIPPLSATYPMFRGYKLPTEYWSYNKDNYLTFIMPSASEAGFVDLIVEGPVGYGLLTESVRVNTFNPFVSSDPKFATFVPYQMPYLSGIEVRS